MERKEQFFARAPPAMVAQQYHEEERVRDDAKHLGRQQDDLSLGVT